MSVTAAVADVSNKRLLREALENGLQLRAAQSVAPEIGENIIWVGSFPTIDKSIDTVLHVSGEIPHHFVSLQGVLEREAAPETEEVQIFLKRMLPKYAKDNHELQYRKPFSSEPSSPRASGCDTLSIAEHDQANNRAANSSGADQNDDPPSVWRCHDPLTFCAEVVQAFLTPTFAMAWDSEAMPNARNPPLGRIEPILESLLGTRIPTKSLTRDGYHNHVLRKGTRIGTMP